MVVSSCPVVVLHARGPAGLRMPGNVLSSCRTRDVVGLEGDRHVHGRFRALVGVTLEAAVEAVARGVLERAARHQLVLPGRPGFRWCESPDALAVQQFRTARD